MEQKDYQVFGYRWVNLIAYTLVTFVAGMGLLAMAPLLGTISARWSISFGAASLLIAVFGLFMLILSIPSGWISGKISFKLPVVLGASLLALGFFLRSMADKYAAFMICNIVAAVGWGIIFGPVGSLVMTWFPSREVGLAISLWPAGFLAGQAFGSLTSIPFLITFGWSRMWLVYGIIAILVALLAWVLLRPRPLFPPESRPPIKPAGIGEGIRQTMNCANITLQYVVFASVGSLVVSPALVPSMLIAKGVAPQLAGVTSGLALVGGMLGSLFAPPFAFTNCRTRATILICAILAPIFFIALFYAPVTAGALSMAITLNLLFGFTMAAVMAIAMGMGQIQPGVNLGNAGILAGVFLTSIGLGVMVFPPLVGLVVDTVGLIVGAWILVTLAVVSFVLLVILVPEPKTPPHGG